MGEAAGRRNGVWRMAAGADEAGLYRLRSAADVALHGPSAYRRRDSVWQRIGSLFLLIGRLALPVLLLLSALAAMYLYKDTKVPAVLAVPMLDSRWLTVSHLVLPVSFFVVALTNRRYGPAYALAQVMLAFVLAAAAAFFAGGTLSAVVQAPSAPLSREVAGFSVAFLLTNFLAIVVFDGARGPRWWTAPLLSAFTAAIVYPLIFAPIAYAGTQGMSLQHMAAQAALMAVAGIALLLPYWMLRGLVPPLSGFGGY